MHMSRFSSYARYTVRCTKYTPLEICFFSLLVFSTYGRGSVSNVPTFTLTYPPIVFPLMCNIMACMPTFALHNKKRLIRTLAGLDDSDTEGQPSVIVTRHGMNRSNRNLGGGGNGTLTYTVARQSSVVGSRVSLDSTGQHARRAFRRNTMHVSDDDSSGGDEESKGDDYMWRNGQTEYGRLQSSRVAVAQKSAAIPAAAEGGRMSGSGPILGSSRRHSSGSRSRTPATHLLSSQQGTWGAFSREHRRDSEINVPGSALVRSTSRRSKGETQRRSRHEHHHGGAAGDAGSVSTVSPGTGGGGATGVQGIFESIPSPESSTVSGLSGWRRKRLQQKDAAQRSSRRSAAEGSGHVVYPEDEAGEDDCRAHAATVAARVEGARSKLPERWGADSDRGRHEDELPGSRLQYAGYGDDHEKQRQPQQKQQQLQRSPLTSRDRDRPLPRGTNAVEQNGQGTKKHVSPNHPRASQQQQRPQPSDRSTGGVSSSRIDEDGTGQPPAATYAGNVTDTDSLSRPRSSERKKGITGFRSLFADGSTSTRAHAASITPRCALKTKNTIPYREPDTASGYRNNGGGTEEEKEVTSRVDRNGSGGERSINSKDDPHTTVDVRGIVVEVDMARTNTPRPVIAPEPISATRVRTDEGEVDGVAGAGMSRSGMKTAKALRDDHRGGMASVPLRRTQFSPQPSTAPPPPPYESPPRYR